jgi:hypothetical protein
MHPRFWDRWQQTEHDAGELASPPPEDLSDLTYHDLIVELMKVETGLVRPPSGRGAKPPLRVVDEQFTSLYQRHQRLLEEMSRRQDAAPRNA